MWTATTRAQHRRDCLRFPSDVTDAEWAVLEPLLPAPPSVGRPPTWPMREVVNTIFYVLRDGISWRMRWSPSAGQFGGLDKLDPGCRQAANRVISSAPYASFGVCPAKALCGRPAL
jgi:hypothetical protein